MIYICSESSIWIKLEGIEIELKWHSFISRLVAVTLHHPCDRLGIKKEIKRVTTYRKTSQLDRIRKHRGSQHGSLQHGLTDWTHCLLGFSFNNRVTPTWSCVCWRHTGCNLKSSRHHTQTQSTMVTSTERMAWSQGDPVNVFGSHFSTLGH